MTTVRSAAAAGTFYPGDPQELGSVVAELLAAAPVPQTDLRPMMYIVPHAGYVYSGPVAASAYRLLQATTGVGKEMVLIGPSHFVGFAGLASPGVDAMATPLGLVALDHALTAKAEAHALVSPEPAAHSREHSLEVQLPFLQVALGEFTALALTTGEVTPQAAAYVLDDVMDDPGVVGIVSSDLSHYLDYEAAKIRDDRTAALITGLRHDELAPGDACGITAVRAALILAQKRGWSCRLLALQNSGDTAGSRQRVVGYGAFVIGPKHDAPT